MLLIQMIRRKLMRVGLKGLIVDLVKKLTDIRNPVMRRIAAEGKSYDSRFGIETTDFVPAASFDVSDSEALKAGSYHPSPVPVFTKSMQELAIDYSKFAFIDFGSGKGRILLLASEYPFKKIIGVEFSQKLHEVARVNIKRYKEKTACACSEIELVLENAITYRIPADPCIFYLFNPFQFDIMKDVVANIETSLSEQPREAYLIYLKPKNPHAIEKGSRFRRIQTLDFDEYGYSCYIYKWSA
jgi:SAM-dependent methyltransferase